MNNDYASRITGAFLGAGVGDALGAPAQSWKEGRVCQVFGRIKDYIDPDKAYAKTPARRRLKGLYSLPAQQFLAVAETILAFGDFSVKELSEMYKSLAGSEEGNTGAFRSLDPHFKKSLQNLIDGADPLSTGLPHPGLDPVARVIPLAICFREKEDQLLRFIIESSLMTSSDPRAVAGAAAVGFTAKQILLDPGLAGRYSEFSSAIQDFTRKSEEMLQDDYGKYMADTGAGNFYAMSDALAILETCLREGDPDLVNRSIIREANRSNPPHPISSVNQDFAVPAVMRIIFLALSSESFSNGVLDAVNEGKESCRMGSAVGALLGLRFGEDSIPEDWIRGLLNANQLRLRGAEMAQGYADWGMRIDLATLESDLTRKDEAAREKILADARKKAEKRKAAKLSIPKPSKPELPPQEEAPFAPPPETVFGGELPDPVKAKKQKAIRGRKRISWKEHRRKKRRQEKKKDRKQSDD
mgnify:CR=1 FL=1